MMNHEIIRMRVSGDNENHHLWNNHGTWFICYTVHDNEAYTKRRVRVSLRTKSVREARRLRDEMLCVSVGM